VAILPAPSLALDYPQRAVRLLVGFPAGSSSDIGARLVADWLGHRLATAFVVENRPGAGSNISADQVIRAQADGYTLHWTVSANAINPSLFKDMSFNYLQDTVQIAGVARFPLIMEVAPSSPFHTIADFIGFANANPGKLNMGSSGNGSSPHLAGELFKHLAGVELQHVPYRSSPDALNDLMAERIDVMFDVWPSSIGLIQSGKLRPLGVTTPKPVAALSHVPAIGDVVAGYEASAIQGLSGPKDLPADIVSLLNGHVNAALADPVFKKRLEDLGGMVMSGTPTDFRKVMIEETDKWGGVIKRAGIKLD
jgi:tripartite-type tricarboxylate transporter receptor subunit TctC